MRRPRCLPEQLTSGAFDRAAASDAGVPLARLRRRDLVRSYHGVHTTAAPTTTMERCRHYAVRMRPGDVFSHVTAALLHGLPLPWRLEDRLAIDVAAVHPAAAPATKGVIGHRLRAAPPTVLLNDLPVCTAVEVWCQLAGHLDVEDLVAVADHLLGDGRSAGMATMDDLAAAIEAPGRYRTAALRRALRLARIGSRSPGESRMRVVLVLAGIPEPELNAAVTDATGRVLGHGDTVWRAHRVVGEYEGEQHRTDREQWSYDIRRYDAFGEADWTVVRVTAEHLRKANRSALVARFFRALGHP